MPEKDNRMLVIGPNWLGDAVMALPALQFWRENLAPNVRLGVLAKASLASFWSLHKAIDAVHVLPPGIAGSLRAAREIHRAGFGEAWILPNSFRSALIPWLAGVPVRHGFPSQWRRALLNAPASAPKSTPSSPPHQAWEYAAIFKIGARICSLPPPELTLDPDATEAVWRNYGLDLTRRWIAILPGAARGPAKRWPAESFAAAARLTARALPSAGFLLCGTAGESPLCGAVAREIGSAPAVDLSGRTDLPELAAVLRKCAAVLCNDSGGMHLAAALGTPVAAIFGLTDPERTGPLGIRKRVLRPDGVRGRRDIPRTSEAAERALRSISPERVSEALLELLAESRQDAEPSAR